MKRRSFLLAAAAPVAVAALAAAIAGCTSKEEPAKLHVLTWSDYFAADTIPNFEKEFSCQVVLDYMESSETLRTKLAQPPSGYDVVFPSDEVVADLIARGLLERLDPGRLSNRKNLLPRFRSPRYDPRGEYAVPYMWGTTGIAYHADHVQPAPDSWAAMWDARYVRKMTMLDDARENFAAALRVIGADPSRVPSLDEIRRAKEKLLERKPLAYDSSAKRALLTGDAWLAQIFSGDALQAAEESGGKIRYVIPKEGATLWIDNMCIAKGAPRADLAHAFIDYLLRPEVSAAITNERRFPNPNEAAQALVREEIRKNPLVYPSEEDLARCQVLAELPPEIKRAIDDAWAEIRAD